MRLKKSAAGAVRPSARDLYDLGLTGPVVYGGKVHKMCFRADGTPYLVLEGVEVHRVRHPLRERARCLRESEVSYVRVQF